MTYTMEYKIECLRNEYNHDHNLFDDTIQMNHIDKKLLEMIVELNDRVVKLEKTVKYLDGELGY